MLKLIRLVSSFLLLACSAGLCQGASDSHPKVRAITAFVHLDRSRYQSQIGETLQMLRQAKTGFERAGYEVESVRITTQPFPEYIHGLSREQALAFFHDYDQLAGREKFDANIGPAMITDSDDPAALELVGEILARTKNLEASVIVAGDDGIHWQAVHATAKTIKFLADYSPHSQGNFNFAATAMLPPFAPFYPGSWHNGPGHVFTIGLESANVVQRVFAKNSPHSALQEAYLMPREESARVARELAKALTVHASAVAALAQRVAKKMGWTYAGLDPTPAPLKDISIGDAIEDFNGGKLGTSGTLTASAVITSAVRAVWVKQVGYRGLMLPVLEDSTIAQRWSEGRLTVDSLLAYSAVCGTGLDTIPLPGEVSEEQIVSMLGDMASLAFKWKKPLSARLLPVAGKKAGDRTEFDDPYLVNVTLQPLP